MAVQQYVITIQRQFGSLGRPIAQKMAEILQIEYYDRDIVDKTSAELQINQQDIFEMEEKAYSRMSHPLGHNDEKIQDQIFRMQECIISEIVLQNRSCIIVGRCADYVLRNMKNVLNIFIYAPYEERLKNCISSLNMSQEEAERHIKSIDKARMNYHKRYTKCSSETIENRHILIDSSMLGADGTVELLIDIVRKRFMLEQP